MSVDFYAGCASDRGFALHTGERGFGPAADAMYLLHQAVNDGVIDGDFGVELTASKVPGAVLKQILASMAGTERWPTPLSNNQPGFVNGDDLLDWIDESTEYNLAALEV